MLKAFPMSTAAGFPVPVSVSTHTSAQDLLAMSRDQLIELFKQGTVPVSPRGYSRGTAIFYPGTWRTVPLSKLTRLIWQGKDYLEAGFIRNRWFGFDIFKGRSYVEESWLDGKPALILDYEGLSRPLSPLRDELRQIQPGLQLGRLYFKRPHPRYVCHFALEVPGRTAQSS
jgi:hypothetical protein